MCNVVYVSHCLLLWRMNVMRILLYIIHSESKNATKRSHSFLTFTNVGRLSKFFYCCILQTNLQQNLCHTVPITR